MRNRKQLRIPGYDYNSTGYYFVTICTKDREYHFGEVVDTQMTLNGLGKITDKYWKEIPNHYPHAKLDTFIIMPNHIHGIIGIVENANPVEDNNYCPLQPEPPIHWQTKWGKSLSSMIRGFKIGVIQWSRQNGFKEFAWQKSYYDRVIRNDKELFNIRNYIIDNTKSWEDDVNHQ